MKNNHIVISLFAGIIGLLLGCSSAQHEFNVLEFGAVSDTTTLNTLAIQKAIDKCAEKGGKVIVPAGKYVSGTINLKSNVELYLEEEAELLGAIAYIRF